MIVSSESAELGDELGVLALLRAQVGEQEQLGHADDAVHRRADLVAHVGEELALGLVGVFGGLLGALHFLLGLLARRDVDQGAFDDRRRAVLASSSVTLSNTHTGVPSLRR